jgi:putative membrane protein
MKLQWSLAGLCGMSLALAALPHLQSQSRPQSQSQPMSGQRSQSMSDPQSQSISDQDKHFVTKAMEGNNDEISLAKMAKEKSSNSEVKQFAQRMIDDHTKMGNEMSQVAQQVGVSPPSGTSMAGKATEGKLKVLSGESFDKAYIKEMVKDHREDLNEFNKEAADGSNQAVKDAARSGAKTISSHLHMAEQMASNSGVSVGEK